MRSRHSQYQGEHADDLHSRVELLKDTVRIRQEARGGITIDRVAQRLHGAFEVAFRAPLAVIRAAAHESKPFSEGAECANLLKSAPASRQDARINPTPIMAESM